MPKVSGTNSSKYGNQRAPKNPPHISLRHLRDAVDITAEELCQRIKQANPRLNPTRSTISLIESGSRGASPEMLAAICAAYGLPPGALVTDYQPLRRRPLEVEDVPA